MSQLELTELVDAIDLKKMEKLALFKPESQEEEQEPTYQTFGVDEWIGGCKQKKRGEEKEKREKRRELLESKKYTEKVKEYAHKT